MRSPSKAKKYHSAGRSSKIYPHSTSKVKEYGYGVLRSIPSELTAKYGVRLTYSAEVAKLASDGRNSVLDIKKMLDAQFPDSDSLESVMKYVELLKEAGLLEY